MRVRSGCRVILLCSASIVLLCVSVAADDLGKSLSQTYSGKVFVVRNFWEGDNLRYDFAGQLVGDADIGHWTTDGLVQIKWVDLLQGRIRVECKRLVVLPSPDGLNYRDSAKDISRRNILIDLNNGSVTPETVAAVFSKVFLSDRDDFFSALPDYWKKCFENSAKHTGSSASGCHLNPRISNLFAPSQADSGAKARETQPANSLLASQSDSVLLKPGLVGVSAPKLVYQQDPEYSRAAQLAAFQGICVLSLKVDETGTPKNITIARPLGYGLDEQAIAAVARWKFEPARKAGDPVAVMINVEVQFRMH